jgi:hypothetical protein
VEKGGERREFSTRRELSILDAWAGGATVVSGGEDRASLFKAEMPAWRGKKARAFFLAAAPNRIEVMRGLPLAGEGQKALSQVHPGACRPAGGGDRLSLPRAPLPGA